MSKKKSKKKGRKHSNARGTRKMGMYFASRAECYRYIHLARLQKAGEIEGLRAQPRFELWIEGKKITTYVADFRYYQKGKDIVEDVKGRIFPVYKLKMALYRALYPAHTFREVREVKRCKSRPKTLWKITEIA